MDADLDTIATALYVQADDAVKARPGLALVRPQVGFTPQVTDAELVIGFVVSGPKPTDAKRSSRSWTTRTCPPAPGPRP
jgi:hypothetical protein